MNHNLYAAFAARFASCLDRACMILGDGRAWTYDDIERASAKMANLLVALGLRPGDRVAAQVEKSPEALVLYLASLRAGMVFLPLNPAYQQAEIEYFLNDAQPGLFVCTPKFYEAALLLAALALRAGDHVDLLAHDQVPRAGVFGASRTRLFAQLVDAMAPFWSTAVRSLIARKRSRERRAHLSVRAIDAAACVCSAGLARHSSSTIATSDPRCA